MRSTGIVRRFDELGRVCIPKEVRNMVGISENTPVEICVEDGKLILKVYEASLAMSEVGLRFLHAIENYDDNHLISKEEKDVLTSMISKLRRKGE